MRFLKISRGKVALIDDEDYDLLSKRRWYAHGKTKYLGSFLLKEDATRSYGEIAKQVHGDFLHL